MRPRRRHAWVGFVAFAALGFLGVFVLHGAAAAATCLAAMLAFIGACIYALRSEDAEDVAGDTRTQVTGWSWF